MPCVDDSGNLSDTAKKLMVAILQTPMDVQKISQKIEKPLFKLRSSLRELVEAGLVEAGSDEKYSLTENGKSLLK